jgi:chromate transporter
MPEPAVVRREETEAASSRIPVAFGDAFRFWVKRGFINFGGPAGQIAIMHRELVERKRWVSERMFFRALNFSMLLPGPEAQQLATYIGWRLHDILGGIVAGSFFVIPSILVLLLLSYLAAAHGDVPLVYGLLYGVQPMVIAIVADAMFRIGMQTLRHSLLVVFAGAAFVCLAFLHIPFPLVIAAAGLAGTLLQSRFPTVFRAHGHGSAEAPEGAVARAGADGGQHPSLAHNVTVIAVFLALWLVPLGAVWLWRGSGDVLVHEFLFYTQTAFIIVGGAYTVLTYISDMAVNSFGWLSASEMVRGLGLAESTPGPLIMVTQYVGFFGAWNNPGPYPPLLNGVLGALVTTYATFLPCLLFIFVGAPYIELLRSNRRLQAALAGVSAAVVGVIANLAFSSALGCSSPRGLVSMRSPRRWP